MRSPSGASSSANFLKTIKASSPAYPGCEARTTRSSPRRHERSQVVKRRQRKAERPTGHDSAEQPEQQRLIDQVREANDHLVIANLRSHTLSEEVEHAYQRVRVQYAATSILAESPSLTDLYPKILQAVAEGAGWEFGALWQVDRESHELRCKEVWHPASGNLPEFTTMSRQATFAPGIGLPGRVWSSGEPVWIPDVTRDSNFPRSPIATREGLHAGFAFPIQLGDVVLGVIEFFSHDIRPPDHELMRAMNAIGSQLGQFIQRKVVEEALAEEVARKSAMLDSALDAVVTMNQDGHIVDFNPAAERIFGYTAEQVAGKSVAETLIPQSLREQHREGLARFQQTGEGPVLGRRLELTAVRADGTEFPVELAISTAQVPGRPAFFTAYLRDLTEQKRAEEALRKWEQTARFLADASANIAELTDPRITLQKIASLAVPFFADWCAIDTLTEDGSLERVAVMHDDPAKVQLAHEIYRRYPPRPDDPHGIMKVLRTGHSELVQQIPDSVLTAGAHDGEHLRIMQALGLRSYICVPLCLRGKTSGVLTFVTAESGRTYNDDALRTAEDLARRASVAIENAYLYQMSQDAVRARDEFLSMASHELRNPINALQLRLVGVLREAERE